VVYMSSPSATEETGHEMEFRRVVALKKNSSTVFNMILA
jgi:hypothetical protein